MPLTTYNITGSLKDENGNPLTRGTVTFTPYATHDARVDGANALLGSIRRDIATLPSPLSITAGDWTVVIETKAKVEGRPAFKTITTPLSINADISWGAIVAGAVSNVSVTPTHVQQAADSAAAADASADSAAASAASVNREQPNGVAGLDAAGKLFESRIPDSVATDADVAGREPAILAGTTSDYFRGDKTWQPQWKVGPIGVNAASYGISPDSTGAVNSAGMQAIYDDAGPSAAVQVMFPERKIYNFDVAFQNRHGCTYEGISAGSPFVGNVTPNKTELRFSGAGSSCLTHDGLTDKTVEGLRFKNLQISNTGGTAPVFNLNKLGLIHTVWDSCDLYSGVANQPVFEWTDPVNAFRNTWRDCTMRRLSTATVPIFRFYTTRTGGGCNNWLMEACTFHSYNARTPAVSLNSASTSWLESFVFRNIVGEQSLGGLIHMYGARFAQIDSVVDWDGDDYSDHLFRFGQSTGGNSSQSNAVRYSGIHGNTTMQAGKAVVWFGDGIGNVAEHVFHGDTPGSVRGSGGKAFRLIGAKTYEILSASTTLTQYQQNVHFSGSGSLTCTLPDPTSQFIPVGHRIKVRNASSTALTVACVGGNIYNKTSLAQYAGTEYVSTGTHWYSD